MATETKQQQGSGFQVSTVDLGMVAVALIWGVNAPIVKASLAGWDQLAYNAIRFGAATLMIFGYVCLTDPKWRLSKSDLWRVALLGFLGNGLYQWLFVEAISRTSASNTSLITAMSPVAVLLWGAVAGTDRMTKWVAGGALVSVVGVALVVLGGQGGFSFSGTSVVGDLIALGAMLCWAAYTVYARPVINRVGSSLRVTAWAMLFGALTNLVIGVPALMRQDFGLVTGGSVAGIAFSATLSLVFGYIVYAWAVQRVGGARTAIYINLAPIFAALSSWLFIGEAWNGLQWAGALLGLAGVTITKLEGLRS